ncbi:sulfotransferase family protein [Actinopolymorpha alba]|uniref:sulfotransferase family protein n=1 Tax=Actinopolymorpha alba TaxID=533267 RepID=UPI000380C9AD|nr:sulfotransferase family protein [Actinopolymorpha alba]
MVKVIGAGLPRTGTTSTKAALEKLGFDPCYHMYEVFTHPDHVDRWLPAVEGKTLDWDRVLAGYRATLDWPASYFWREQAEAYPEAKVLLTVRDPERWFVSFRMLTSRNGDLEELDLTKLPEQAAAVVGAMRGMLPVLDMMGRSLFGSDWRIGVDEVDEQTAIEAFNRHVSTVKESLPAERLLVFDVREGWGPLCEFLGVEPPADEPFPRLNDTQAMQENFERLMSGGELASPFFGK